MATATPPAKAPAALLGIVVLFFAALALYAVVQLRGVAADLQLLDRRLDTVSSTLGAMRRELGQTNGSLAHTNGLLDRTNLKLDATNTKLTATYQSIAQMRTDIRTLSAIRGDIHEMVHKISGSFLFRGVK